ncbi:uncharacterized protein ACR2FA_001808 [Aphomia sociella]
MYTLILIAAVTAATAVLQPCTDYCESLLSGTNEVWRPDCVCSTNDNTNIILMPRSKNKPASRRTEAAVYYEPAEHVPSERVSFVYHPFIILNPTFRRHTISHNMNPSVKVSPRIADDIKDETKRRIKYKRKNNVTHKLDIQLEEDRPLYLDVSVQESSNSRSSAKELGELGDMQLIEQNLMDCIDLHILVYCKKNNNITELKKIWGENKFKKYDNMSDSELMINIKNKCNQPSNIHKSTDIDDKTDHIVTVTEVPTEFKSMGSNNNNGNFTTTDTFIKGSSFLEDHTSTSQYVEKSLNNSTNNVMKTISTRSTPTNSSVDQAEKSQQHPASTIYPNNQYYYEDTAVKSPGDIDSIQSPSIDHSVYLVSPDTFVTFTETNPLISNNSINTETQITTTERLFADSSMIPYSERETSTVDSSYIYNKKPVSETVPEHYKVTTPGYDFELKENEINEHKELSSATNINEIRVLYPENELKIPKLIVKEYPNDTIISEVTGNELMPNNDFTHSVLTDKPYLSTTEDNIINKNSVDYSNNVVSSAVIGAINMEDIKDIKASNTSLQIRSTPQSEVTGKLYFNFRNESIPVRFVQKSDGAISMGLDGMSLCEELVRSGQNKSTLLTVLCNCARSQDC